MRPRELTALIDELDTGTPSTREVAARASARAGIPVSQSMVSRRRRQRRAESVSDSRRRYVLKPQIAATILRKPPAADHTDRHIRSADSATCSEAAMCLVCHAAPQAYGGRCLMHVPDGLAIDVLGIGLNMSAPRPLPITGFGLDARQSHPGAPLVDVEADSKVIPVRDDVLLNFRS